MPFGKPLYTSTRSAESGFSLPELLVSIAIITLVTGIFLFRYTAFNNITLLNSQAYELALDVRQAQVAGVSVRGNDTSDFFEEYGIYVTTSNPNRYIFFRDNNGNANNAIARYNSSPNDEAVNIFILDNRFEIIRICTDTTNPDCSGGTSVSDIAISFTRPNFDARFYSSGDNNISSALIVLAPDGQTTPTREVYVSVTGQISVENN